MLTNKIHRNILSNSATQQLSNLSDNCRFFNIQNKASILSVVGKTMGKMLAFLFWVYNIWRTEIKVS